MISCDFHGLVPTTLEERRLVREGGDHRDYRGQLISGVREFPVCHQQTLEWKDGLFPEQRFFRNLAREADDVDVEVDVGQ